MRQTKNYYKTVDELLDAEVDLVKFLIASRISKEYIHYKLSKSKGPYHANHLMALVSKSRKEALDRLLSGYPSDYEHKYSSGRTETMSQTDPVYLFDTLRIPGRTAQIEMFDMLLLTLSPEFRTFVSSARILFEIPEKRFEDYGERKKHFNKLNRRYRKRFEGSDLGEYAATDLLLYAINHFIKTGTIFGDAEASRYSALYIVIFDYITFGDPFRSTLQLFPKSKDKNKDTVTATRIPLSPIRFLNDSVDLMIAVYPTTTKDEVKAMIDEEWHVVEHIRKRLPILPERKRMKDPELFNEMIRVYEARERGLNYVQINNELGIGATAAKNMVSRVKLRIAQLKKGIGKVEN